MKNETDQEQPQGSVVLNMATQTTLDQHLGSLDRIQLRIATLLDGMRSMRGVRQQIAIVMAEEYLEQARQKANEICAVLNDAPRLRP